MKIINYIRSFFRPRLIPTDPEFALSVYRLARKELLYDIQVVEPIHLGLCNYIKTAARHVQGVHDRDTVNDLVVNCKKLSAPRLIRCGIRWKLYWWNIYDRQSRLTALDKVIKHYKSLCPPSTPTPLKEF